MSKISRERVYDILKRAVKNHRRVGLIIGLNTLEWRKIFIQVFGDEPLTDNDSRWNTLLFKRGYSASTKTYILLRQKGR